jgi:hypothetical protein
LALVHVVLVVNQWQVLHNQINWFTEGDLDWKQPDKW